MTISLRTLSVLAAAAGCLALAVALAAQHWEGLVPCPLCLLERWPWRVAVVLAGLAIVSPPWLARAMLGVAVIAVAADAAVAFVHVGVEQRWWPSPLPECSAPSLSGSLADRLADLPAEPSMSCEDPVFLWRALPLSMATLDCLYALAVAGGLATLLRRRRHTA